MTTTTTPTLDIPALLRSMPDNLQHYAGAAHRDPVAREFYVSMAPWMLFHDRAELDFYVDWANRNCREGSTYDAVLDPEAR